MQLLRPNYLNLVLAAVVAASFASAAQIKGGLITENTSTPLPSSDTISIFGNNFSISWIDNFTSAPSPGLCTTSPTCTNDFSQTLNENSPGSIIPFLVTYNGSIYNKLGGYSVILNLTFTSQSVTVPVANVGLPRVPVYLSTWSGVPFTATGSFTVMHGATVVLTDTLDGFGLAGGTNGPNTGFGTGGTSFTYAFAAVPEPASVGLVSIGILAGFCAKRRRSSVR